MSDPTNADQPVMPAPLGKPIPTSERAPADDLVSPPPPAAAYPIYPAYPLAAPPWGLDPSHAAPVYIVDAGRRSRGWVPAAAAVLVTIVVIFGALDLIHLIFPQPGAGATSLIIQINQPNSTSLANAVLKVSPAALTVSCRASAAFTLTNSGSRPLTWSVDALPDSILMDQRSPHAGTLAQGQRIGLTVVSLGQAGAGTLRISDDLGEKLDLPVSIRCP